METRVDQVAEKHKSGYNCAQAVACAYCDLVGIDEETMFRMTEGLGLGMGGMEGTCGAVTAACVIAGAKNSTVEMGGSGSKGATYKISFYFCFSSFYTKCAFIFSFYYMQPLMDK